MAATAELNVSLEPHLAEALAPLQELLPESYRSQLRAALSHGISKPQEADSLAQSDAMPVISYALLSSISTWTRSAEGLAALQGHSPPLQPSDYSMIALLAGTRTAPDRKFPAEFAPLARNDEPVHRSEMDDRRAITALLNALLSILGSGAATWWAADRLRWQNEWKVLLALFVAFVVAAAEGGLYLIWSSRRTTPRTHRRRRTGAPRAALEEPPISSVEPRTSSENDQSSPVTKGLELAQVPRVQENLMQDNDAPNIQTHLTVEGLRARSHRQGSL
ncbi:hypothetical protein BC629DRAFT_1275981 [Irpex lacteus]|nr:hypothetical protein BC629DRAFT_1275981 [Irpex lacteus]